MKDKSIKGAWFWMGITEREYKERLKHLTICPVCHKRNQFAELHMNGIDFLVCDQCHIVLLDTRNKS